MGQIIFVTGTDTGVGKTTLVALLVAFCRARSAGCLAMKPFCAGNLGDAKLLYELQGRELPISVISPFRFREAVAPLVAARRHRRAVKLNEVLKRIRRLQSVSRILLVEGCGGLLVPLGEDYSVADLIVALDCRVVVVARNKLGAINQTLLTIGALKNRGVGNINVVLMECDSRNLATRTNPMIIRELIRPIELFQIGNLKESLGSAAGVLANVEKAKKTLARLVETDRFSFLFSAAPKRERTCKKTY